MRVPYGIAIIKFRQNCSLVDLEAKMLEYTSTYFITCTCVYLLSVLVCVNSCIVCFLFVFCGLFFCFASLCLLRNQHSSIGTFYFIFVRVLSSQLSCASLRIVVLT